MKKYLLAIILTILCSAQTHASTEGRIFLEVKDGKTNLEKIYQRGIKEENLRKALLYTGEFLDISEDLKRKLRDEEKTLEIDINPEPGKNPFVKILYSFNNPPEIELLSPKNGSLTESNEVLLEWKGKDYDGKFLEYSAEIYKDKELVKKTSWSLQNYHSINLKSGEYFWKVYVRDNSFLNNVVISQTFSFEIYKEPLLEPQIVFPKNGFLTNEKQINFVAKTNDEVINQIFLNNKLLKETVSSEIDIKIDLLKEGKNVIKIISLRNEEKAKKTVTFQTKWTPPSKPDFEFKLEGEEVFLRIKNEDYTKAYIYIDYEFFKEIGKTSNWISLGQEIYGETKIGVILEDEFGNKTEILYKNFVPEDEVLGIGSSGSQLPNPLIPNPSICMYKYNSTRKRFEGRRCNITAPRILTVENINQNNNYSVSIVGVYNPDMLILIDEYKCTLPIVCNEKFVKRTRFITSPYTAINVHLNESFKKVNEFRKINKYFFATRFIERNNPIGKRTNLRYHINHGIRYDENWININFLSPYSNTRAIPPARKISNNTSSRIFRFPFSRNIGVTQWHGYTAFQSPHTGIDFGSYREPIYAVGNGIIREAKWDDYAGVCLSGGYFVRIEHDNGMNSVYLHLENFRKSNGRNWRVGERIRRGELIGRSGNTGAFNCQPLGYHLHFELRKNHLQRNHVNPVPYINVNWDNIPTLNHTTYPDRLTGNNPHPTW